MVIISILGTLLFLICIMFSAIGAIPTFINEMLYNYYIIIPVVIIVLIDYCKYNDSTVRQSGGLFLLFSFVSHLLMLIFFQTPGGIKNLLSNIYLFGFSALFTIIEFYFCLIFFANVNDCKKKLKSKK